MRSIGNENNNTDYSMDPIRKLNSQIDKIEEKMNRIEKINIKKLKNIGKKLNK
jgi:tetrahydromethanopterin S-methyltransferase subunit G